MWARPIQALYSIDGQTVGVAIRTIAIVAHADLLDTAPAPPAAIASVVAVAPQQDAPDLTARITYSEAVSDGRLLWTFETPHDVPIPTERIVTDIGAAAASVRERAHRRCRVASQRSRARRSFSPASAEP